MSTHNASQAPLCSVKSAYSYQLQAKYGRHWENILSPWPSLKLARQNAAREYPDRDERVIRCRIVRIKRTETVIQFKDPI
jgi:hypothetical protein